MTDKDEITGQAAAAVGRSVAVFRSTPTPRVKYTLAREKNLFGRKVVQLKPDQPDRRLRPCVYVKRLPENAAYLQKM